METLSTKVHKGTADDIEEYRQQHGIDSRSEAIRRLLQDGLDEDSETSPHSMSLPTFLIWMGWLFLTAAYVDAGPPAGEVGAVLFLIGVALTSQHVIDTLTRLKSRLAALSPVGESETEDENGQ